MPRALLPILSLAMLGAVAATLPAQARPVRAGGLVYEGACDAAPPAGTTRLYMGHFTGGTYGGRQVNPLKMPQRQVIWADEYRCFSSQARCYAWQRSLHRAYGRIESNWTCLPIR